MDEKRKKERQESKQASKKERKNERKKESLTKLIGSDNVSRVNGSLLLSIFV
jgi:hypothetical protein